jgi:2-polyprenyl-3-methyl-5-hydroxy-6-metoxy-1,4-benzoquinol methylase
MSQIAARCPLCGSDRTKLYLDGEDSQLEGAAVGSSRSQVSPGKILRCRVCTFGFREMRPSESELTELYRRLDVSVYESELAGRERTAKRHFGIVKRFVNSGTILDIGCASGLLLRLASDDGWQVYGVEPSEHLYQHARESSNGGGEIFCSTLQDAALPQRFFDAVTFWDVLEHVPDPNSFMQLCASLLKPGGHLFLNVPDIDSLPARVLRSRWPLLLPEHLNYFTKRSLQLCASQAHLKLQRLGRRPASFSVNYILYRLAQHQIPATGLLHKLSNSRSFGKAIIPIPLGELYGVWKLPQ